MNKGTYERIWIQWKGIVQKTLCHLSGENQRDQYVDFIYEPYGKAEKAIDQEINKFIDSIQ